MEGIGIVAISVKLILTKYFCVRVVKALEKVFADRGNH